MSDIAKQSNLTSSQLMIWLGQKLNPEMPLYNMVFTFTINGKVEPQIFSKAFQELVNSSDALRTTIQEINGIPQQKVLDSFPNTLSWLDFSSEIHPQSSAQKWIQEQSKKSFNLEKNLFDSALIKVDAEKFIWYLNQHHLIADAWSVTLAYSYLHEFYSQIIQGQLSEIPQLPSYADYISYEKKSQNTSLYQEAVNYWQDKQKQSYQPISFYGKTLTKPSARTQRISCNSTQESISEKLREIAKQQDIRSLTLDLSLFNIFATILFAYLYRVSGETNLTIASPAHNRPTPILKKTLGVFIELFPLQVEIEPDETFISLLDKVKRESGALLRYASPGTSHVANNRNINVVLNYINRSLPDFHGMPVQTEWIHAGYGDEQHHLRLEVHDFDGTGNFKLLFDFNCELISETKGQQALNHFGKLLDAFIENVQQPIAAVEILNHTEQSQILEKLSKAISPNNLALNPLATTIIEQFQQQVKLTPDQIAIVFGNKQLTYAELDAQGNQLAHYLSKQGVGNGTIVGVFMNKSIEAIVAILGILKAGAAYLPCDPDYPEKRITFILEDGQVSVILTQHELMEKLSFVKAQMICLDTFWQDISQEPASVPEIVVRPKDLAYIIYTSGSTGTPKGAMINHQNVIALVQGLKTRIYEDVISSSPLRVAWIAPMAFDPSVQQIWAALLQGHILYPVPQAARLDGKLMYEFYQQNRIDISDGTPVHLKLLLDVQKQPVSPLHVQHFIIGGDVLYPNLVAKFTEAFQPTPAIENIYGVAECCVDSLSHRVLTRDRERENAIPIGTPLPGTEVYLMNDAQKLQPIGVPGEIYIGGEGVGLGYWQRPELTTERFINNPFYPGKKLYRTGDLGKYEEDGTLLFLGRQDHQVKIRGYRIELGEIEQKLLSYQRRKEENSDFNLVSNNKKFSAQQQEVKRCTTCLISSEHPGVTFDSSGVCSICNSYDHYKDKASQYFQTFPDFQSIMKQAQASSQSQYDCMLLYSGGKDSSYVLYRLVEMGYKVLAFTFDNGFISPAAIANIKRQTSKLGVKSIIAKTENMNEIFVESLNSDSTVCSGCFKSLTAISTQLAQQQGINVIITGLSRGQIFETKLAGLYKQGIDEPQAIEEKLLLFRKLFHTKADWTNQLLGIDLQEVPFEQIYFLDFFRYDRTPIEQIKVFLKSRDSYWQQPQDTGFCSSNCMMNDVGICVHGANRGYHNYEAPLSWDIRLGISQRKDVLPEVKYPVDLPKVNQILDRIGYFTKEIREAVVLANEDETGNKSLYAYFVANQRLTASELRAHLAESLPDYAIPKYFIQVKKIPLTPNGKLDRSSLPNPKQTRPELNTLFIAPSEPIEKILAQIWIAILKVNQVGIYDNFFDLGGDSIMAIQIASKANQLGLHLSPNQLFQHPTIKELAEEVNSSSMIVAEQGLVSGLIPLTPIQQGFLAQNLQAPHHWNQSILLEVAEKIEPVLWEQAIEKLLIHHDALRLQFKENTSGYEQFNPTSIPNVLVKLVDLSGQIPREQDEAMIRIEKDLQRSLNLAQGELIKVALFDLGANRPHRLLLIIHHLVVDRLSWGILLADLQTLCQQLQAGKTMQLPLKTDSWKTWSEGLVEAVNAGSLESEINDWLKSSSQRSQLPLDYNNDENTQACAESISVSLTKEETKSLLQEVPQAKIKEILLAALVLSWAEITPMRSLQIDLEVNGREQNIVEGINLTRTVGQFDSIFPVTLSLDEENDLKSALNSVQEQLDNIPNKGIGYGMLRYLNSDNTLSQKLESIPHSEILFNYQGVLEELLPENSLFQLLRPLTLSGNKQEKRQYILEINAFVMNEQLWIDWVYSRNLHQEATIQSWADNCLDKLRSLITYCISEQEEEEYTSQDFSLANLDQDTLSKISRLLN